MRRIITTILATTILGLAALGAAASAMAAPLLDVTITHLPETIHQGDEATRLSVAIKNITEDTDNTTNRTVGTVTAQLQLPPGFSDVVVPIGCDPIVANAMTCTRTTVIVRNGTWTITLNGKVDDGTDELPLDVDVSGGGAPDASGSARIVVLPKGEFGPKAFYTSVTDAAGDDLTQAGGHPFKATTGFSIDQRVDAAGRVVPVGRFRDIDVELPPGFVGNPQVVEACPSAYEVARYRCPPEAIVGYIEIRLGLATNLTPPSWVTKPIYNVAPGVGMPALFAFEATGPLFILPASVRSDGDFGLTVSSRSQETVPVHEIKATFCGFGAIGSALGSITCRTPDDPQAVPFLSNPGECSATPPVTRIGMDQWTAPGVKRFASYTSPLVTGCDQLPFDPSVVITPTDTSPDAPTGLDVDLAFPQDGLEDPIKLATAHLKKAIVTLPEGMTINPAGANGLAACSDAELNLRSKDPVSCPNAAKVGTVTATSPLLEESLSGGVYIRSQNSDDPESGEMFRLALVLENKERGLSIRLPGQIRADRATGRLVTTFDNNPQLPVSDIKLRFKDGPRAPLMTPPMCGPKTIETVLTSWGGQTEHRESTFDVDCTPGMGGFDPAFSAGTSSPAAGASSTFSLVVSRQDGEQELKAIRSVRLPEGLLGRVASVPLCDETQAAVGGCPVDSRVGRVEVAAGAGSNPLWVPEAGREPTGVYLTGPYKDAPYGLSIKVPAQAGPFDLGTVVVRTALHVDERTAAITSGVDESRLIARNGVVTEVLPEALPRILGGVVLNQREIRLIMDREGFMVNPTDCSEQQIAADLEGYGGGKAAVGNRFTAVNCARLGFAPKFSAKILDKGRRSTLRSWHPRTRFAVVPRKGDANIAGARVALPSSTILDQSNIGTTCTRAQMAERACPPKSVVGYAKAWSPLLRKAVEGPVYLAANGGVRPLPDLAAVLDGEIRVVLQGEISTLRSGGKARLQNTFRVVPDAPVNRFVLTMRGGKNTGLLVNSTDLCRTNERGVAVFSGQNGLRQRLGLRLTPSFKGCAKVRRQAARRMAARKAAVRKAARNVG